LIGDSGWLGIISAPASFTALKVVPGGVFGGRLSIIRLVWFTTSKIAIERAATIVAITTGFRSALSIPINVSVSPGFRSRPWRGVVVPSNLAGAIRAARSGCQLPVQKPDINLINRNVWTDRSSFILQIEHIFLAVDDLPSCVIGT
jgi:hypothetical protein